MFQRMPFLFTTEMPQEVIEQSSFTSHGPGVWVATDSGTADAIPARWIADAGAANHIVTQESGNIAHRHQSLANARLISAAPDLLEACKALVYWLETPETAKAQGTDWRDILEQGRLAITKAQGE